MNYLSYPGMSLNTSSAKKIKNIPYTDQDRAEKIIKIVTKYFEISITDISSTTRRRSICYPRQVAMYLMIKTTALSLTSVGEYFGGKDHTTVIYAKNHIHDLVKVDLNTRQDVDYLRNKI